MLCSDARMNRYKTFFLAVSVCFLSSCELLGPVFEEPTVSLQSVQLLEQQGHKQLVGATLALSNPNSYALSVVSVDYLVAVNGFQVADGLLSNVPTIPAGGDALVDIVASVDLIASFQLVSQLLSQQGKEVAYTLTAGVDTGMPLIGTIQLVDNGVVSLTE